MGILAAGGQSTSDFSCSKPTAGNDAYRYMIGIGVADLRQFCRDLVRCRGLAIASQGFPGNTLDARSQRTVPESSLQNRRIDCQRSHLRLPLPSREVARDSVCERFGRAGDLVRPTEAASLTSGYERAGGIQNFFAFDFHIAVPQERDRHCVV